VTPPRTRWYTETNGINTDVTTTSATWSRLRLVARNRRKASAAVKLSQVASPAAVTVSALLLVGVLKTVASFDVVDDIRYKFMYLVLGLAWLRFAAVAFAFVGVSARDDAIERGNSAAAIALAGALVGAALCYVGGNIGDGPGWWVVVFSAVLSTLTSLVFWIVLSLCSPVIDAVVIDRDRATGARLAGFLIARRGTDRIADFGGVQSVAPVLAGLFLVSGLAMLSLPGLSTFVSEFLVLIGTFSRYKVAAVIATAGIILAAIYVLWMYQRAMNGPVRDEVKGMPDLRPRELLAVAPLVVLLIGAGVYPKPVLDIINPAVRVTMTQVHTTDPKPAHPASNTLTAVQKGTSP